MTTDPSTSNQLRWWSVVGVVVIWIAHSLHVYWLMGGPELLSSRWPILVHDHPFVWHNALAGAHGLRTGGVAAVYDPRYMAGYVNSFVGSTNPSAAWWVLAAGEARAGWAYNLHCYFSTASQPLLLTIAAGLVGVRPVGWLVINGLWVVQFWSGYAVSLYVPYGMVAFVNGAGWWVLATVMASRFLSTPTWSTAGLLGLISGLACMSHLSLPILLALPALIGLIVAWPGRSWRTWLQLTLAIGLCLLINLHWLGPIAAVWSTLGTPPVFFINTNVRERLYELLIEGRHCPVVGIGLGCWGAWELTRRLPRPLGVMVVASILWAGFLALFAGRWRIFHLLEPGRHTLTFAYWCSFAAGAITLRPWTRRTVLAASALGVITLPSTWEGLRIAWINSRSVDQVVQRLPTKLPPLHQKLTELLQEAFPAGARVYFEDCNAGVPNVISPFGDFRTTPILQRLTGLEFIGGPYLKTRYRTNIVQVGDGLFFGQPWSAERFQQATRDYAVTGIVCWSPAAVDFCRRHPQWCRPLFERSGFFGFEIVDLPHPLRVLGGQWRSALNRLEVTLPADIDRPITLPYHYFPGLSSIPDVGLVPVAVADDPTPLIQVTRPTTSFVIEYH